MVDCSEISAAAEAYFDALHAGDAERLGDLFVPEANLYASSEGELQVMPVADYLALVAGRASPACIFSLAPGKSSDRLPRWARRSASSLGSSPS